MARIRTVKPEFFRHELLQEMEKNYPEYHPMLLFAGLWGHCDRQGVFEWRPRMLALDILPFLWEGHTGDTLGKSLVCLRDNGLIIKLIFEGKEYGFIPSYLSHQRVTGREGQEPARYPQLSEMTEILDRDTTGTQQGHTRDTTRTTGREGKGIGREVIQQQQQRVREPMPTEDLFVRCFEENDAKLRELFPAADIAMEREVCVAHYRNREPPADALPLVLKWFQRIRKSTGGDDDGSGGPRGKKAKPSERMPGVIPANGPDADWLGGSQFDPCSQGSG